MAEADLAETKHFQTGVFLKRLVQLLADRAVQHRRDLLTAAEQERNIEDGEFRIELHRVRSDRDHVELSCSDLLHVHDLVAQCAAVEILDVDRSPSSSFSASRNVPRICWVDAPGVLSTDIRRFKSCACAGKTDMAATDAAVTAVQKKFLKFNKVSSSQWCSLQIIRCLLTVLLVPGLKASNLLIVLVGDCYRNDAGPFSRPIFYQPDPARLGRFGPHVTKNEKSPAIDATR